MDAPSAETPFMFSQQLASIWKTKDTILTKIPPEIMYHIASYRMSFIDALDYDLSKTGKECNEAHEKCFGVK